MYSRFSKKEIVALSITGITTFSLVSVLFSASASSPTTEDFLTGLEKAFPKTTTGATNVTPVNPIVEPTATGTTVNTGNTTTTNGSHTTTTTTGNTNTTTSDQNSSTTIGNTTYSRNTGVTSTTQAAPTSITQIQPQTTTSTSLSNPNDISTGSKPLSELSNPGTNSSATSDNSSLKWGNTSPTNPVSLNSASQCKLPAIDILQVEELDTKTVVRWREVIGAVGYDVMKRSQSGQFVFIERVKTPIYTAHLARGKVKYEDLKIAAVCSDTKTASINTSKVTRVKTGPVQLLLILLLSMNIGAMFMLQKKLAFRKYFMKFIRG